MLYKMIFRNIKRSISDYIIYITTLIIVVALFYSFTSISSNKFTISIAEVYNIEDLSVQINIITIFITFILIFLVSYINKFMINKRKKEFGLQSLMGIERKTLANHFFCETFCIGNIAIIIGLVLGGFFAPIMKYMATTIYDGVYQYSFGLYPDTMVTTVILFELIFLLVGFTNRRELKKITIIEMLRGGKDKEVGIVSTHTEGAVASCYNDQWVFFWIISSLIIGIFSLYYGTQLWKMAYEPRLQLFTKFLFGLQIFSPFCVSVFAVYSIVRIKKGKTLRLMILILIYITWMCWIGLFVYYAQVQNLALAMNILNGYNILLGVIAVSAMSLFFIRVSYWLEKIKTLYPAWFFRKDNMVLIGQLSGRSRSYRVVITLISITLMSSVVLLSLSSIVAGWIDGFSAYKNIFDVQISSHYRKANHPQTYTSDDYLFILDYLSDRGVLVEDSHFFHTYFLDENDFSHRQISQFPVLAVRLSDYNVMRALAGEVPISLEMDEFALQYDLMVSQEEMDIFSDQHTELSVAGNLLVQQGRYQTSLSEALVNYYTPAIYIIPDITARDLMPATTLYLINTVNLIPYSIAIELEQQFNVFSDQIFQDTQYQQHIWLKTLGENNSKGYSFLVKTLMIYTGIVLSVICFVILSVQQLVDIGATKKRLQIIEKIGCSRKMLFGLIGRQMMVWFLTPLVVGMFFSIALVSLYVVLNYQGLSTFVGGEGLFLFIGRAFLFQFLLVGVYMGFSFLLYKHAMLQKARS